MAAHEPRMFGDLSPRAEDEDRERDARRREQANYFLSIQLPPEHISTALKRAMARFDKTMRPDPDVQYLKRLARKDYSKYLQTEHWREFRTLILCRDHGCRLCASKKNLEVHHLNYDRLGEEAKEDVIVLCPHCHERWHKKGPFRYPGDQK